MRIFLDTSSLFKLYVKESDTHLVEDIFINNTITTVFLSEIAELEFASTVWKKVRKEQINEQQARKIIERFESDFTKYAFVQIDNLITSSAKELLTKYGKDGLRTLDSIQLSTAVSLFHHAELFITADKLLGDFFKLESLPTI